MIDLQKRSRIVDQLVFRCTSTDLRCSDHDHWPREETELEPNRVAWRRGRGPDVVKMQIVGVDHGKMST